MGEAIFILPSHFFLFMLLILSSYEKGVFKQGFIVAGLNCFCVVVVVGVNRMLKLTMLLSTHMVELDSGVGL